jgi:hypothetical protein
MRFMVDIPDNVGVPGDELVEGIKKRLASVELRNGAVYFMDSVSVHQQEFATDDEIQFARDRHGEEGEVEIDEPAIVSRGADDGCYVQAWVWVPSPVRVYELTPPWFDASTDRTDYAVIWVACPEASKEGVGGTRGISRFRLERHGLQRGRPERRFRVPARRG